jgi:tetratricopeptide (TPR) repeat protein
VIHANDSKGALGSHLDRHEHLGQGTCGRAFFASIAHAAALRNVPLIMETPKEGRLRGRDPDRANAAWLRALALLLAAALPMLAVGGCRPWAKPESEVAAMRSGVAVEPTPEEADRIRRAQAVAQRGEYQQALVEFRSILAENPRLVDAQLAVGRTTMAQGDLRAAQRSYEAAIRADPRNVDAQVGLAGVHAAAGRPDDAMKCYRQALVVAPGDLRAVRGVADMLEVTNQQSAALPFIERLCADPGADAETWTRLGQSYLRAGRNADATAAFEEAVALGEVEQPTMDGLVAAYTAELRYSEAASAAGEYARRWPTAAASERAAWLAFRAGDYGRAIAAYRTATQQDPGSIKAWNGVGVCALNAWILSDRLDGAAREEARGAFERSLAIEPAQPQVTRLLQTWAP